MRAFSAWMALGLVALSPTVVLADVISDEEGQCRSKKEGDVCEIGDEKGVCAKSSCARNDYSEGVPPKTKQVECLICDVTKTPQPTAEQAPEAAPDEDEASKDGAKKAEAKDDGPAAKKAKSSGCSVGGTSPVWALTLLALAFVRRR
ncbi:MAG: MYXO-CTERM sorting domain-containing protein [Nannocystaceae bacterium]|nr:MYXO-CTERM sorting domain-containing protein [bacterium]